MKKIINSLVFIILCFTYTSQAQTELLSSSEVTGNNPTVQIVQKKFLESRITMPFGKLVWNKSQLAIYANKVKAVITPIESDNQYCAVTFIGEKNEQSEMLIFQLKPDSKSKAKKGEFTGRAAFLDLTGKEIHSATFKDNKLLTVKEANSNNAGKLDKSCFRDCIKNVYNNLPIAIKGACTYTCATCIVGAPTILPCLYCAACILTPAAFCFVKCNK